MLDALAGVSLQQMLFRYTFINVAVAFSFVPVAALILSRHPRHRVGWIMMWVGVACPLQLAAGQVARMIGGPETLLVDAPLPVAFLWWLPNMMWILGVTPIFALLPLFFPNDRLPSPRWRWLVWASITVIVVIAAGFGLGYFAWAAPADVLVNTPPGIAPWFIPWAGAATRPLFVVLVILSIAALASVVVRYRSADGGERQQLKWLLLALAWVVPLFGALVAVVGIAVRSENLWVYIPLTLLVIPIPVAVGIAILRYRLFDIDVTVSRSIVYAGLAGFITAVYVGVVVGVGRLFNGSSGPSLVLQIGATAVVAVLFQPVRGGLQRWANSLVFGQRSTPYEVLASFSLQAGQTPDESALPDIARLLAEGTGADRAVVWLRVGQRLVPAASRPPDQELAPVEADPSVLAGSDTLVAPVVEEGELLGALAVTKRRGETFSPQDDDVVHRLATGVGLLLRNLRLTAELRARLEDLEASRHRVVAAQDEARRRFERDLHDGAEQELDGLGSRLVEVRSRAEEAPGTAQILDEIIAGAEAAAVTLRDLGRGIYPPLLESDGLAAALVAQADKAPLPVTVQAAGVGRHGPEVEAAVYFCVLEALNNVAKYAQASSAQIRLDQSEGELSFVVTDDGIGFDPADINGGSGIVGMADRLDTIGGTVAVASRPGHGTVVSGRVKVAVPA
jgi:signal transduction histidine kinase